MFLIQDFHACFFFYQTAISALQSVLQEDFKATEIEVELDSPS